MALKLKALMKRHHILQADMAGEMGIARPTLGALINHGQWPRSMDSGALKGLCVAFLKNCGVSGQALKTAFEEEVPEPCVNTALAVSLDSSIDINNDEKDDAMLLRKQGLAPAAKKHFGLFRDPLADEMTSHEDVFVSPDIRFVREGMWQTARHGGFIAVVGESGSGKSTLRKD